MHLALSHPFDRRIWILLIEVVRLDVNRGKLLRLKWTWSLKHLLAFEEEEELGSLLLSSRLLVLVE